MVSFILGMLPVVLSLIVLGAHFLRSSNIVLVAVCVLLLFALFIPRRWVPRIVQAGLILATLEWVKTLVLIVQERMAYGAPYTRTAVILGAVALLTLASTLAFRVPAVRRRYRLD